MVTWSAMARFRRDGWTSPAGGDRTAAFEIGRWSSGPDPPTGRPVVADQSSTRSSNWGSCSGCRSRRWERFHDRDLQYVQQRQALSQPRRLSPAPPRGCCRHARPCRWHHLLPARPTTHRPGREAKPIEPAPRGPPLEGVRIVDRDRVLAGPAATTCRPCSRRRHQGGVDTATRRHSRLGRRCVPMWTMVGACGCSRTARQVFRHWIWAREAGLLLIHRAGRQADVVIERVDRG